MSHFTVAVITDSIDKLEEMLAPYDENIEVKPYIDETKENYAKMESIFTTWALLDETGWHEKGKMGWWAVNDSTKDSELLFIEKFTEIINKPENQDKYLIIVDCHI